MLSKSRVVVISSVSGGGKTSLIRLLVRNHPELWVAVTATSRAPRDEEIHGVDYFFYTEPEFQVHLKNKEFLEHAYVHGNHYGVPQGPVLEKLEQGRSVILNIDFQGMRTVRERLKDRVVSVFILPPNREEWENRLRSRATDSEEQIRRRLEQGELEMQVAPEYDYRVVNDVLERATGEVSAILESIGAV